MCPERYVTYVSGRTWPADPQTPAEHELIGRLNSLLLAAVPDKYVSVVRAGGERDLDECWMSLLGRIGPALLAIALAARSAERSWSAETSRGGSDKDRSRRYLIETLVDIFASLFGRWPEPSPGSAGYRSFLSLIELAARRAAAQRNPQELETIEDPQELQSREIDFRPARPPWKRSRRLLAISNRRPMKWRQRERRSSIIGCVKRSKPLRLGPPMVLANPHEPASHWNRLTIIKAVPHSEMRSWSFGSR